MTKIASLTSLWQKTHCLYHLRSYTMKETLQICFIWSHAVKNIKVKWIYILSILHGTCQQNFILWKQDFCINVIFFIVSIIIYYVNATFCFNVVLCWFCFDVENTKNWSLEWWQLFSQECPLTNNCTGCELSVNNNINTNQLSYNNFVQNIHSI